MFDIDQCYDAFSSGKNRAYFWSGLGPNGQEIAADIAKENGGTTLEMLMESNKDRLVQAGFEYDPSIERFVFSPDNIDDWRTISNAYAEQASGEVHAVLGDRIREDSVWNMRELPALKENNNVHSIVAVDPSTGKDRNAIFEKPNVVCGPSLQDIPPVQPPHCYSSSPPAGPDNLSSINRSASDAASQAVSSAAESGQNAAKSLTGGMV